MPLSRGPGGVLGVQAFGTPSGDRADSTATERLLRDLEAKATTGVTTAFTAAYERGGLAAVAELSALGESSAAPLVGLDTATYNRIERGVMIPGPIRAARIAKGTGGAVPASAWRE